LKKRIDVAAYDRPAPSRNLRTETRRVIINVTQPYAPTPTILVKEGDRVDAGQKLAAPEASDDMGVPVYASLAGRVAAADAKRVVIDRTQAA
jgi:Na+-translocating ferredoxin:NAD+ oxidoreductase RnfC subunit